MAAKTEVFVQFNDIDIEQSQLIKTAKEEWTKSGNKVKDIKELKLYVKPAERKCYYIINNTNGSFDL